MSENIVEKLRPVIENIVTSQDLVLYDLEYVFENDAYFLRVSIEKKDHTMDFETAEVVSDLISNKLDELDPIDHQYILDVCSPGIERPIRSKEEMLENVNNYITVNSKNNSYTGDLLSFVDDILTLQIKDKTRLKQINIKYEDIDSANIAIKF